MSKLYFIDSTPIGSTAGNPPAGSMYLYVVLFRKISPRLIGEKIVLPLLTDCWYGWHMPWAFYF